MTHIASPATAEPARSDDDLARAYHWSALARLLERAPDRAVLDALRAMQADGSALGQAWAAVARAAGETTPGAVQQEYFDLFIGVGRGELLPYASFYLTGFLNERPLAELRSDLAAMGVGRVPGRHEPEDHIASLCDVMAGLAAGRFSADQLSCGGRGEDGFFARHVHPWAAQFFDDLAVAPASDFYRTVAEAGRQFVEIEARGFALARSERTQ